MADTVVTEDVYEEAHKRRGLYGPYWISVDTGLIIYINNDEDIAFSYTTDAGVSWDETQIVAGTATLMSVWFDQETPGDAGTKVNIAWLDSSSGNAYYVNIDVSDASQGTIRTVSTGLTIDEGSVGFQFDRIALTKTVSGNLIYSFSTQVEIESYKSDDLFATPGTAIANLSETPTDEDWILLFPASTVDDNDACALYWDINSNIISMKMYDDSSDDWTETAISGSMIDKDSYINMDGVVRHSDGHILFVAHLNGDNPDDDLMTWDLTPDDIDSPTVTAKTNVFTNQSEAMQTSMIINQQNDDVYIAYLKGNPSFLWKVDVVFHKSENGMGSWGSEEVYNEAVEDDYRLIQGGRTIGNSGGRIQWSWYEITIDNIWVNLNNDIEIGAVAPEGTTRKIKISGIFQSKPIKTKVSGSFEDKPIQIKVGGTFQ